MSQGGFGFTEEAPFSAGDRWADLPLVSLDLETTGPEPAKARILEVAAIRFSRGQPLERWSSLADPGVDIPAEASAIHKITRDLVVGAPAPRDLAPELVARCSGCASVSYNGLHFDLPILERELGITRFGRPAIDVMVWLKRIDRLVPGKGRFRLSVAAARHGVEMPATHRAMADAEVAIRLLAKLRPQMPETLGELLREQTRLAADQEADFQRWKARQQEVA